MQNDLLKVSAGHGLHVFIESCDDVRTAYDEPVSDITPVDKQLTKTLWRRSSMGLRSSTLLGVSLRQISSSFELMMEAAA